MPGVFYLRRGIWIALFCASEVIAGCGELAYASSGINGGFKFQKAVVWVWCL